MIFPSKSLDNYPRNCGWPFLALSRLPCFLSRGKVEQQQPRLLESMESMMETESIDGGFFKWGLVIFDQETNDLSDLWAFKV